MFWAPVRPQNRAGTGQVSHLGGMALSVRFPDELDAVIPI